MIIVRLNGGLGNQMFQYAHGRALAEKLGCPLKLDLSIIEKSGAHGGYCLDQFHLAENLELYNAGALNVFLWKLLKTSLFSKSWVYLKETDFSYYDLKKFYSYKSLIVDGYWQSEKYFVDVAEELKREFTPRDISSESFRRISEMIKEVNSVSLHIRRGDYLYNPVANKFHGVLSIGYYKKAVELVKYLFENPKFFVFSDDPDWVEDEFQKLIGVDCLCVSDRDSKQVIDLTLMSSCKYNIVANSSYSWWAAWLNSNPSKKVIAPKKWFSCSSLSVCDLLPPDWILL